MVYFDRAADQTCGSRPTKASCATKGAIAAVQVHYYSETLPTTTRMLGRNFTPKRHRLLQAKDLPKVSSVGYVAARPGFEPTTLRTKGDESKTDSPRPPYNVGLSVWLNSQNPYLLIALIWHCYCCMC